MQNHDWNDLTMDYEAAKALNEIDAKKEEAQWRAMSGK